MIRYLLNIFFKKPQEHKDSPEMKYLVVGLGNIGREYVGTRHNIGFEALEQLATEYKANWKTESMGDIARIRHKGRQFILLKPSTYVNLSGKAVRYWLGKEKLDMSRLIVVLDDLNLDFGSIRIRDKGSDGGHNGLKNIQEIMNTKSYVRIRLGIGNSFHTGQQVDYVLGKWTAEERKDLPELMEKGGKAALAFGTVGLSHAMNTYNK